MIYVTGVNEATASVDEDLKASGDDFLVAVINSTIEETRPNLSHANSSLAFLYYELLKKGMNCTIDAEDLADAELPEGATP